MAGRFVQVDLGFVDSRACGVFALRLGLDRDSAAGKMLRAWSWALEQAMRAPDGDPIRDGFVVGEEAELLISEAARWTKTPQEFAEAGERAGLLSRTKRGIRFLGWEQRYGAMLRKLRRDATKPARNPRGIRAGNGRVDPDVDVDVDVDIDPEERTIVAGPRKPSWQQATFTEMQEVRLQRLKDLDLEAEPETFAPAFINSILLRIQKQCGGDRFAVLPAWDRFLATDWGANYDPPYKLKVFASPKVLPNLLTAEAS